MGRDCASEIGPIVLAEGRPEDLRAKASAEIGVAPKPSSSGSLLNVNPGSLLTGNRQIAPLIDRLDERPWGHVSTLVRTR